MRNAFFSLFFLIILFGCSTNNGVTTVVPLAPTNLTASVISTTQVDLQWVDNATNETGYKIQRKTTGGNFSDVGSTGADISTFSNLGLIPNATYTYRVYAYNPGGNSLQYSNEITLTTQEILNPNPCDTTAYKFSADIKPIFVANCDNCHGLGGAYLPELGTYALIKNYIDNNPGRMEDAINGTNGINLMPKNSSKMPDCSINKIQNWINAGAPNN